MIGYTTAQDTSAIGDRNLDQVSGGKVLEVGIGPMTIQINPESRCWAIWVGKEYAAGGCKK